jgi:hypothetical protein
MKDILSYLVTDKLTLVHKEDGFIDLLNPSLDSIEEQDFQISRFNYMDQLHQAAIELRNHHMKFFPLNPPEWTKTIKTNRFEQFLKDLDPIVLMRKNNLYDVMSCKLVYQAVVNFLHPFLLDSYKEMKKKRREALQADDYKLYSDIHQDFAENVGNVVDDALKFVCWYKGQRFSDFKTYTFTLKYMHVVDAWLNAAIRSYWALILDEPVSINKEEALTHVKTALNQILPKEFKNLKTKVEFPDTAKTDSFIELLTNIITDRLSLENNKELLAIFKPSDEVKSNEEYKENFNRLRWQIYGRAGELADYFLKRDEPNTGI